MKTLCNLLGMLLDALRSFIRSFSVSENSPDIYRNGWDRPDPDEIS